MARDNSRIFKTADPAVRFAPGTAVVLGKLSFANEKGIVAQGENGNAAFKDIQIKPALNMPACSKIRGKLNQKIRIVRQEQNDSGSCTDRYVPAEVPVNSPPRSAGI